MRWLPTMVEHRCTIGERGGFFERLRTGTWLGHILEHVTLELQSLAGTTVGFGRARETKTRGVYKVAIEYKEEKFAIECLHAAHRLLTAAIDEILGSLNWLLAGPAVTGRLECDFRRPVPVGSRLHIDAEVVGVDGAVVARGMALSDAATLRSVKGRRTSEIDPGIAAGTPERAGRRSIHRRSAPPERSAQSWFRRWGARRSRRTSGPAPGLPTTRRIQPA
jgi:hypothetical protein